MNKQTIAVLGPGSWVLLIQVLNDNGHQVRIQKYSDQIDEINTQHTNKRYFKEANRRKLLPIMI